METKRPTNPAAEEVLGRYSPVLDHGFASLIDYMGGDESIERAARVSYGAGTRKVSQTRGLIRYLRRHHHTTPSEMVEQGLSPGEIRELRGKLQPKPAPGFELDLSRMRTAEEMEEKMYKAVPSVFE